MCAMLSVLFTGSNDGRTPSPYKENLVSLNLADGLHATHVALISK